LRVFHADGDKGYCKKQIRRCSIFLGINLLEKKAEDIDPVLFMNLEANDILFIDTSHIIRPQGDVVFLYLEILPQLKKGVFVHIHDIFTPRDYPDRWIIEENRLWNEQYLLEAFITMNKDFRIIGALNYLMHNFNEQLSGKLPVLANEKEREPGSFWMMKN
jgi:hypothetical protein